MKHIILFASAVAMMLLGASCQKEPAYLEGDTAVSFQVQAGDAATKAIADASNITVLHWELYGSDVRTALTPFGEGVVVDTDGDKTFKLDLQLISNIDYNIVFWAETEQGSVHYVTDDLRSIRIASYADENANDETRAAFFCVHSFRPKKGVRMDETVYLNRPFAQVNFGSSTYDTSLNMVNGGKVVVESTEMTVSCIANTFNTIDGVGESDPTFDGTATFKAAATPNGADDQNDMLLEVSAGKYYWLGMNYLIVEGNSDNVKLDVTLNTNMGVVKHSFDNVPVKENYRTNIIGDFLTTGSNFEIIVDETFNTPSFEIQY